VASPVARFTRTALSKASVTSNCLINRPYLPPYPIHADFRDGINHLSRFLSDIRP
jgi:hypothetical protein